MMISVVILSLVCIVASVAPPPIPDVVTVRYIGVVTSTDIVTNFSETIFFNKRDGMYRIQSVFDQHLSDEELWVHYRYDQKKEDYAIFITRDGKYECYQTSDYIIWWGNGSLPDISDLTLSHPLQYGEHIANLFTNNSGTKTLIVDAGTGDWLQFDEIRGDDKYSYKIHEWNRDPIRSEVFTLPDSLVCKS